MTVTHGTRSAYNKGCRCEECREASRLARARKRDAVARRAGGSEADAMQGGGPWIIVTMTTEIGAMSLWHAMKLSTDDEESGDSVWPWVVAGAALLGIAAVVAMAEIEPLGAD